MESYLRKAWIVPGAFVLLAVANAACRAADEPADEAKTATVEAEAKIGERGPLLTFARLQVIAPSDNELLRAQKERYNAVVSQLNSQRELFQLGTESLGAMLEPLDRLARSAEPVLKREEHLQLLEECVKVGKSLEAAAKVRHEEGFGSTNQVHQATYVRADLEVRWLEAKKATGNK